MNADELTRKFPGASADFIRANISADNTRAIAQLESTARPRALAAKKGKGCDSQRFFVRVTSRRGRLLDEDNLCPKYHVDLCRYAGVIPGDAPDQVSIQTRQQKVGKSEAEEIVIEVSRL